MSMPDILFGTEYSGNSRPCLRRRPSYTDKGREMTEGETVGVPREIRTKTYPSNSVGGRGGKTPPHHVVTSLEG